MRKVTTKLCSSSVIYLYWPLLLPFELTFLTPLPDTLTVYVRSWNSFSNMNLRSIEEHCCWSVAVLQSFRVELSRTMEKYKKKLYRFLILQTTLRNLDRVQRENNTLNERLEYAGSFVSPDWRLRLKDLKLKHFILSQSSPQGTRGPRSLHQEMECDDDDMMQVMSDMPGGATGQNPIVMEAKAVYKQLRTLCGTLKNSHDDDSGLHSDLSLGSIDNTMASQPSSEMGEGTQNFRQGMLSSAADDLMRSIMALDAVHFKAMLDQSRGTVTDQEDELRRRQDVIMELESKVSWR